MANTYTSFHYHFTFSTKNREPWIVPKIENRVWAYVGGIALKHKITAVQIGGIEDHIHALVMAPNPLRCSLSSTTVAFTNGRHKKALPTTYCCISSATRRIPDYVPKRRPDAVPDPPPGVPCTVHATVRVSDELAPSEFFFSH